jgi:hypothetical protein
LIALAQLPTLADRAATAPQAWLSLSMMPLFNNDEETLCQQ